MRVLFISLLCLSACGKEPELDIKVPQSWNPNQQATTTGVCTCTRYDPVTKNSYTEVRNLVQTNCQTLQDEVIKQCRFPNYNCTVSSTSCPGLYP